MSEPTTTAERFFPFSSVRRGCPNRIRADKIDEWRRFDRHEIENDERSQESRKEPSPLLGVSHYLTVVLYLDPTFR